VCSNATRGRFHIICGAGIAGLVNVSGNTVGWKTALLIVAIMYLVLPPLPFVCRAPGCKSEQIGLLAEALSQSCSKALFHSSK